MAPAVKGLPMKWLTPSPRMASWSGSLFKPLEAMLAGDSRTGRFCHGDTPGLADLCLYAQVLNNSRFGVVMSPYPIISRIVDACATQPAFAAAAPDQQPDAE